MRQLCKSLLAGLFLFSCTHCSVEKNTNQTEIKSMTYEEDLKAVNEAWENAKTEEEKIQLGIEFLKRNKSRPEVVELIESIAISGFLKEFGDSDGMLAFARNQTADIEEPQIKRQADLMFVRLYSEAGDRQGLENHVKDLESKWELSISEYEMIVDAALKAKDWETALFYSETMLKRNTAPIIRAETEGQVLSEEQVDDLILTNRSHGLLLKGRALTGKGDADAAIAAFMEASRLASYNYTGFPNYPLENLNLLWARALLENGDYAAAIEKVSVEAVICERKEALETLKKAHDLAGLGNDLDEFVDRTRSRVAKNIPGFQAVDYDGKKVYYRILKGKVTLISLWSPFCGPCRVELPRLKPIYEEYHRQGLEIVVVDGINDTRNSLKFIEESGLPYRFLEAGTMDGHVEKGLFGFPSFPTTYLIDQNNKLVYVHIGYSTGDEEKHRERIIRLLKS